MTEKFGVYLKFTAAQQSVHLMGGIAERQCALAGRCSLEARSPDLRHFLALSLPEHAASQQSCSQSFVHAPVHS